MPVLATTLKKGGDFHEGLPILDGLFVRIQKIEVNGKLRIVEQWNTDGVFEEDGELFCRRCELWSTMSFEDAERFLPAEETTMPTKQDGDHSPENISWNAIQTLNKFYDDIEVDASPSSSGAIGVFDDAERFLERNEKRDGSTRSPKDISPEETTKPTEQDGDHSARNISLLNKFYDDIDVDVSPRSSGAVSASPASICGKRKYDPANGLQRRKKVVEVFLRGIEKLLNPGYASFLRESLIALNISTLNILMNTFRFEYNAYLSGRTDVGETISKMALKRVLHNTFESLAPYDTGVAKLHSAWQVTKDRSNRKGQGSRQVHAAKWWQNGDDNAAQGDLSGSLYS